MRLCSFTVFLGTALLLSMPGDTQALSDTGRKDLAVKQDLAKEIILGVPAMDLPEEGYISKLVKPGTLQDQVGPEEDLDNLHHPQDDAREADVYGVPWTLSLKVQNDPEEDRDQLHHS